MTTVGGAPAVVMVIRSRHRPGQGIGNEPAAWLPLIRVSGTPSGLRPGSSAVAVQRCTVSGAPARL